MNNKNKEVNYLSLFLLGISLVSVGVNFMAAIYFAFITIMGAINGNFNSKQRKMDYPKKTHMNNSRMTSIMGGETRKYEV